MTGNMMAWLDLGLIIGSVPAAVVPGLFDALASAAAATAAGQ